MGPVRLAFVILLIAAAVVAFGLVFAQDQTTLRPRSELAAEDPRFPAYLAALIRLRRSTRKARRSSSTA